ncbi:MAG: hypothetical protein ACM3N4_09525 [Nitrososphaerota archaeon]
MQDELLWRYTLAQQIAARAHAPSSVAAMFLEGSVAQRYADRFSDIDLAIVWTRTPTAQERRDIVARARGYARDAVLSRQTAPADWAGPLTRDDVALDVRHTTVQATEQLLVAVLELADLHLARQQRMAALTTALPLMNPALITQWQQQAAAYPFALSVAMVQRHLRFRPAWEHETLAERNDALALYGSFCAAQKHLLLVLLGINGLYYPGWRWIDHVLNEMRVTPPNLAARLKQLFAIVSIDPLASVYQLHELIDETFALVETHLPAVDTSRARARFQSRRMP